MRYLQPGRFVCSGPGSEAPFMWFFPMAVAPDTPKPGSAAAVLGERFAAYRQHVRATFFDTHFASFDRQVMLVDVLGALHAGRAAFEDTARVIGDLAAGLRYGSNALARALASGAMRGSGRLLPSALSLATEVASQALSGPAYPAGGVRRHQGRPRPGHEAG